MDGKRSLRFPAWGYPGMEFPGRSTLHLNQKQRRRCTVLNTQDMKTLSLQDPAVRLQFLEHPRDIIQVHEWTQRGDSISPESSSE